MTEPLRGRVVLLRIEPPGVEFFIAVTDAGLEWLDTHPEPDATVEGSPRVLAGLALGGDAQSALFSGQLKLSGDLHTARAFQRLLRDLRVDWASQLEPYTGSEIAALAVGLGSDAKTWIEKSQRSIAETSGEFLQQEIRALPSSRDVDGWSTDVDGLRDDAARLEARLSRLESISRASQT